MIHDIRYRYTDYHCLEMDMECEVPVFWPQVGSGLGEPDVTPL